MGLGGVVTLVEVHHAVVVAYVDQEGSDLEADTAAEIDVEAGVDRVVEVAVRLVSGVFPHATGKLRGGSETVLRGRAGIDGELGVTGKVDAVVQIQGDVDRMLHEGGTGRSGDAQDRGGAARLVGDHGIIDTGSDAEPAGERKVVGEAHVCTVGVDALRVGVALGGIQIAHVDGLGKSLGTEQHQGCSKDSG